jgi:hypothetical protein
VPADDSRQRRRTGQLNIYYDAIIERIRGADSILILGPGEAKGELKRRMEQEDSTRRVIIDVEPAERMTDRQISARVRTHFRAPIGEKALQAGK